MGCGIPVIASPVGMNLEVVHPNINGFIATIEEEWKTTIEQYINDKDLQSLHGKNNSIFVEKHFSLNSTKFNYLKAVV
jgi:glycosyltransferase involved in cell wall biosynthesis